MWRPGIIGTLAACTLVALIALSIMVGPKEPMGFLPHVFFAALTIPFVYDAKQDEFGYGIAFMLFAAPIAYLLVVLAANWFAWNIRAALTRC